jgi:hypothetical protein
MLISPARSLISRLSTVSSLVRSRASLLRSLILLIFLAGTGQYISSRLTTCGRWVP